jgi:peptide subunit release factor 1 (eRF1)
LLLGGTEANTSHLSDLLPKVVQDRVIGTFTIDFAAPVSEVQSLSMDLIEELAERREGELVDSLVANWKRGSGGVVGLSDTMTALLEQRASHLLVSAGYEASGFRCQNCRYLMLVEHEECPLCGGQVEPVEDLVDTLTHRALEQGTEVEIIRDNETLESAGSIGALLRF